MKTNKFIIIFVACVLISACIIFFLKSLASYVNNRPKNILIQKQVCSGHGHEEIPFFLINRSLVFILIRAKENATLDVFIIKDNPHEKMTLVTEKPNPKDFKDIKMEPVKKLEKLSIQELKQTSFYSEMVKNEFNLTKIYEPGFYRVVIREKKYTSIEFELRANATLTNWESFLIHLF